MSIHDELWSGQGIRSARVIDAHAHIGSWMNMYVPQPTAEMVLREMDRFGVDISCVSSTLAISTEMARGNDEVLAALRAHPGRFLGYVTLNPNRPVATNRRELERLLAANDGFIGVKLHPMWHDLPVDGDEFRPLWELAAQLRPLVLGHCWMGREEPEGHNPPERYARMAERYPNVTVIMGHGGGSYAGYLEAIELCARLPNLYMDICGGEFSGIWMERLLAWAPPGKVLFASDQAFLGVGSPIGRVGYAQVSEEAKRAVFGVNMANLLERAINWKGN